MFTTTSRYKENQAALRREIYYEIEYGQIDTAARDSASVDSTSLVTEFSKINEIINKKHINAEEIIASLEENQFILDKSRTLLPSTSPEFEVGVWGKVKSDAGGGCGFYAQIKTAEHIDAAGLTITFYKQLDQFAVDFDIVTYLDAAEVKRFEIRGNNKAICELEEEIFGVNTIRVEIKRWNMPFYYPKITQIDFGLYRTFGAENLTGLSIKNKVSVISETLQISTISFKFINDGSYDPIFMSGKNKFIQERQPIKARIGAPWEQIENIDYEVTGTPKIAANEVEVTGNSFVAKLDKEQKKKWKVNTSLKAIAEEMFSECGIAAYEVDNSLAEMLVTCLIGGKYRDTVQDLLIASGCVLIQKSDKMHIRPMSYADSGFKIKNDISAFPTVEIQGDVKKVIITKEEFKPAGQITEIETYAPKETGLVTISISDATNISVVGGTATDIGVDCVTVSATLGTDVVISGKKIEKTETVHEFGTGSIAKKIDNNPFITNPQEVANRILTYYFKRQYVAIPWRQDNAIELLDVIKAESDYGDIKMVVEEQNFEFDGGMKGTTTGKAVD